MATTTHHYHYQTTPGPQHRLQPSDTYREAHAGITGKDSWELTTRASSFESLESWEDQQTACMHRQEPRRSKPSSKTTASRRRTDGKHSLNSQQGCCSKRSPVSNAHPEIHHHGRDRQTGKQSGARKHQAAHHPQHQSEDEAKYKTEMCKNLRETGHCKFGSKCKFAHSEDEVRNKTHINLHYRSKKCEQFFEQGYCPYGSRCQYLHTEDSYAEIFNSYCEKLLVWTARNPQLDMTAIMRKTHPFVTSLPVFSTLAEKDA